MLADLRLTLGDREPVDRLNAMLVLLAMREIGAAVQSLPPVDIDEACDSLSDADWQAIVDRQSRRRGPETTEPRKE